MTKRFSLPVLSAMLLGSASVAMAADAGVDRTDPATTDDRVATGQQQDVIETPGGQTAFDRYDLNADGVIDAQERSAGGLTGDEPFLQEARDAGRSDRGVDRTDPGAPDDTVAAGENQDVIETPGG